MKFLFRLLSVALMLVTSHAGWTNQTPSSVSNNSTDPVPLVVIFLGTALIGLWIWARRK